MPDEGIVQIPIYILLSIFNVSWVRYCGKLSVIVLYLKFDLIGTYPFH